MNDLKSKFRQRQQVFGAWTSLGHPQVSEMLVCSGVDFLGIDIEHSTISHEQSQRIIAVCKAKGIACLPRVASHNPEAIRRLLDSGADGIIVPNVETSEQIEKIIDWMKYPPFGKRGFGIARAQGYGHDFEKYISTWNENSILVIQIESKQAVENIDDLLKYDEVDGVMIGPYDISGSLKIPGQIDHPLVQEAGKNVVEACTKFGKGCGTQEVDPNLENIGQAIENGYTFIVLASDIFILWKWGEKMQEIVGHHN